MTGLDYALLGLLGLSAALGFWRGLLSEIVALGAWVLAFVMARTFMGDVQPHMVNWIREPVFQSIAAFLLVFVLVLLGVGLVRWLLSELIRAAGLGVADRFLGACFGLLRGGAILFAVAVLVGVGGFATETWWRTARLSAPLETVVMASRPWLPELLANRLRYR